MRDNNFDKSFWDSLYAKDQTGWDIGEPSPPLVTYLNQLQDKSIKLLIPGAGRAYEAVFAYNQGFENVFICDISENAIKSFKSNHPQFPTSNIIFGDFFEIEEKFNLILEQTFFCALDPSFRNRYVDKMNDLLYPSGKLVGVLFDINFQKEGPPFGGKKSTYETLFNSKFDIQVMDICHNSIIPRENNELFIIMKSKD